MAPVRDEAGRVVDLRLTYLNPAAGRAFGREVRDLVGRRIAESFPGVWDEPGLLARYVAVVDQGTSCEFETRSNVTGQGGWFHVIASPLQGCAAVWFTNITERKQQEAALREADRRKDEFLAVLAHELRNPLAPIRQCVQIARSAAAGETRREWAHGVIDRQVQNMSLLLDDLLDVSRITRGTLLLRKSAVALSGVIEAALEIARPHVEAKGHRLQVKLPDQPVMLEIDPLRMSQVLGNLLTNAAKYTDPGGHIGLAVHVEPDALVVRVTDDGIGLDADQLGRIFEMFAQIDDAKARSQGGLGIGLAMSRGLVELHGGRLTARSAGAGRGSEFTVRLPAAACALRQPEAAAATRAAPQEAGGASLQMLIADDNIDAADSLAALLRMHGHVVHVAYDGEAALAAFHRFEPHAVLLDVGMPRKSGLEVARAIRGSPAGKRAILIAVTGWGRERDRRDALEAGFDHHTTKPMDPAQIQALLAAGRAAVVAGQP
jgi:signal transduction histidine kinase/CheY-like chemotaxis protein